MHSVLFLILAFFNAAALFVLIGAEFIAMILVIVYVGAVAVLFLFVVMMLDIDFAELKQGFLQYLPVGALVGLVLLAEFLLGLGAWRDQPGGGARQGRRRRSSPSTTPGAIGACSTRSTVYFFQVAGLVLLVAMIGAIVLTAAPAPSYAGHREQHARPTSDADRVVKVRPGGEGGERTIGLGHYLAVAAVVFTLGIFGIFLNRKNVIVILMSIELILLAVNINLVAFSVFHGDHRGPGLRAAGADRGAAEAAIGLAILVVYFRNRGSIAVEDINADEGLRPGINAPWISPSSSSSCCRCLVPPPCRRGRFLPRASATRAAEQQMSPAAAADRRCPVDLRLHRAPASGPDNAKRRGKCFTWIDPRHARGRLVAARRHADGGDADGRHRRVVAGPCLFDRLHGRGSRHPALLRVSQPVHLLHADAGDVGQPGAALLRLGRRRSRLAIC